MIKAPERLETERLLLRRPRPDDADAMFRRYTGDLVVGQYLAWPVHRRLRDTQDFIERSQDDWERWPAGPYLVLSAASGELLGSTGLRFETPTRVSTGYVLARDSWGRGYATEALLAMRQLADDLGLAWIYALCHTEHRASWHVLEKAGFRREGVMPGYCEFPNLADTAAKDVYCYTWAPRA